MLKLILGATLFLQQPLINQDSLEAAVIEESMDLEDRTEEVMHNYDGLRQISNFQASEINVKLYMTSGAQEIIDNNTFDIPNEFNPAMFYDYVKNNFTSSMNYYHTIEPVKSVRDLNIVIVDMGEGRRNTISAAKIGTNIIEIDIRRWHKLYSGMRPYLAGLTSIHEYVHVNNYVLDTDETKLPRELTAIIFEGLSYVRENGEEGFRQTYLTNVAGNLENKENLLSEEYTDNTTLRYLSYQLINNVLNGNYQINGNKIRGLEHFAAAYLTDIDNDDEGFDDSCMLHNIRINNEILTLQKLRQETYNSR